MKRLLPVIILLLGIGASSLLYWLRPNTEVEKSPPFIPLVHYHLAEAKDVQLTVRTQGPVQPRSEIQLTPEVSGRILQIAPNFEAGGFFSKGDWLVEIDPLPYEVALAEAQSILAGARLSLAQEIAQGEQAREDWAEMGRGEPPPLAQRIPQQEKAQAEIAAAEAAVRISERNLRNAWVRAPYDGRLRDRQADVGQVVTANSSVIASIYGVDAVEVRLPLSLREAGDLILPEGGNPSNGTLPSVTLRALYGGQQQEWEGKIVRSEGSLDPRTRLLYIVARVDDPYDRDKFPANSGPLTIGLFVEAEIEGRLLEDAYRLPRTALRGNRTIHVIDSQNRLRLKEIEVRQSAPNSIVVTAGVGPGDRISLTPVEFFVEGMEVMPLQAEEVQQ